MQLFCGGNRWSRSILLLFSLFLTTLVVAGCGTRRWSSGSFPVLPQRLEPAQPVPFSSAAVEEVSPAVPEEAALTPTETEQKPDTSELSVSEESLTPPDAPTIVEAAEPPPQSPEETTEQELSDFSPPVESSSRWDWLPSFFNGKKAAEGNLQYLTEQDLLKVVGELQRLAGRDSYRFPAPKDVTGANVYKATLTRLQDYETKHPGAYPELVAFTRARAYERLREYDRAVAAYQVVSHSRNRLNPEATKAIEVLTSFQEVRQRPLANGSPLEYLQSLEALATAWQELQQQYAGTSYETLAREEEERLDQAKVLFLELNRHRIEDGNQSIIVAYHQLISKHQESKNRYRYQMELGDVYRTLAQEYVAQHDPQSLDFEVATFEELGRSALRWYGQVANEDGAIEKLEAKGKLQALEAYMAKIGRLGR